MIYEFLPNFFLLSLSTYNYTEWWNHDAIKRNIHNQSLIVLLGDMNLVRNDHNMERVQILYCKTSNQFHVCCNEYMNKNTTLLVIFDQKKTLKFFLSFFIENYVNGARYENSIEEILKLNTGNLFVPSSHSTTTSAVK
jgi:hypothetical protein